MLKQYLEAGQIVGTHGVQGEMRAQPWCDSATVFAVLKQVYLDEAGTRAVKIKSRVHGRVALVTMEGITSMESAQALRGQILYAARQDIPLESGAYFVCDLIGLTIRDADTGEAYGTLTQVSSAGGANDVYHMDKGGREVLIPVIPPIVKRVDVDAGVVEIHVMEGLFE